MSWNEEFLNILASFGSTIPEPIEYRIHYNDSGDITACSMIQHPENTQYLIVDSAVYENYFRYRVNVTKKILEKIDINLGISVKLKKSTHGYAVVKNHAGLILDTGEEFDKVEYYDTDH